jgi:tetratricopeptide (TPR) repeat protein
MKLKFLKNIAILLIPSFFLLTGCGKTLDLFGLREEKSHARIAQELTTEKKYSEAIAEYQKHIDVRFKVKNRDPNENPYFYYLLIGDLYLKLNDPKTAEDFYRRAHKSEVPLPFITDRYRLLAKWHEENGDVEKSMAILNAHKELDPLLFNAAIDDLHKKTIADEISNSSKNKE